MGRKKVEDKRSNFTITINSLEKREILEKAGKMNLKPSEFIRFLIKRFNTDEIDFSL